MGVFAAAIVSALLAGSAAAAGGWSIEPTPNPSPSGPNHLVGISCPSSTFCIAVGYYALPPVSGGLLAERWDGHTWTIQTVPNPKGGEAAFAGVSCSSPQACIAVGGGPKGGPLVERWHANKWTIVHAPKAAHAREASFAAVSCTAARACVAVGEYSTAHRGHALIERWNGHKWLVQTAREPKYSQGSGLAGVSCTSRRSCMAVGLNTVLGPDAVPIAERWDGKTWSLQTPGSSGRHSTLQSVSCTSPQACTAVGFGTSGVYAVLSLTLAERWNGHKWSIQSSPNPSTTNPGTSLNAVSCSSSHSCTAVGAAASSPAPGMTLVEHWDGHAWAVQPSPNPTGAIDSNLSAVACLKSHACTAVGDYAAPGSSNRTLAEGSS